MVGCLEYHHRALLALCAFAGLRVGEACTVTAFDLDIPQSVLTVRGKGDRTRVVPLSSEAMREVLPAVAFAIVRHHQGGDARIVPLNVNSARRFITRLGKARGVRVASHDLRSTFATETYEHTLDVRVVQELLGHASVDTTQAYVGVSLARMRAAVETNVPS